MSVFRRATFADSGSIVELIRRYYAEDGYPFEETSARRAVQELVGDERLGWMWIAEEEEVVVGYLAVTLGFSLEYRGRDAFVDELYLLPVARGRGSGSMALELAEETCRGAGVRALHLEVEKEKEGALELYRRAGFVHHERFLMTKLLVER